MGEVDIEPGDVIFFEGIFVFNSPRIRDMMKYKIYVNCDNDILLCRRIDRDIRERGRAFAGVVRQYFQFVRPGYLNFVVPMMKYANLVVPSTTDNSDSIDFIVSNLLSIIRSFESSKYTAYFFGERHMFLSAITTTPQAEDYLSSRASKNSLLFLSDPRLRQDIKLALDALTDKQPRPRDCAKLVQEKLVYESAMLFARFISVKNTPFQFVPYAQLCGPDRP